MKGGDCVCVCLFRRCAMRCWDYGFPHLPSLRQFPLPQGGGVRVPERKSHFAIKLLTLRWQSNEAWAKPKINDVCLMADRVASVFTGLKLRQVMENINNKKKGSKLAFPFPVKGKFDEDWKVYFKNRRDGAWCLRFITH